MDTVKEYEAWPCIQSSSVVCIYRDRPIIFCYGIIIIERKVNKMLSIANRNKFEQTALS